MDSLKGRNSPKTPKTDKSEAEIVPSPYKGGTHWTFSGDADLFGLEQKPKQPTDRPEAAALVEVLRALRAHPLVAWAERQNSGAAKVGNRFIRFGWPGCPDVLGQLNDGRLLGVEVKAKTGRLRPEQAEFLKRINGAGGVGFVARDLRDVLHALEKAKEMQA